MASYSEATNKVNHYGMTEEQEDFLRRVLIDVRNSREIGKKVNAEDVIDKVLDTMTEQ